MLHLCVLWAASGLAGSHTVSQGERVTALRAVIEHLQQEYVDPVVGERAARKLQEAADNGRFDSVRSGEAYARAISDALQQHTGDGHLNLEYSATSVDTATVDPAFEAAQLERWYGAAVNHGVERIERLAGNVALLDLRVFPPLSMGADTMTAAMTVIAAADVLIIDLRHNGGGIGAMANLVASYLFDSEPQPLTGTYHRPSDTLAHRHTQPHVPGRRFGPDKPVYVLIS
ncbi:MAG: S41 family peptidase, partial [Pseudomonadota bacterium]